MTTSLPYTEWLQCRDVVAAELERQDPGVNGQKLAGDLLAAGYIDTARILADDIRPQLSPAPTVQAEWVIPASGQALWEALRERLAVGMRVRIDDRGRGVIESVITAVRTFGIEIDGGAMPAYYDISWLRAFQPLALVSLPGSVAIAVQRHSRACGWRPHAHGVECHPNCPTCHGRAEW